MAEPARAVGLLRSAGFRLAAVYAVLFCASAAILFAVVSWTVDREMRRLLDAEIETEFTALAAEHAEGGVARVVEAIEARRALGSPAPLLHGLLDPGGRPLVGGLAGIASDEGWADLSAPTSGDAAGDERRIRALTRRLPDGAALTVGADAFGIARLDGALAEAFLSASLVTAALALAGGALVGAGALRRIEAIGRTTRAVVEGRLSERAPVGRFGDEIDLLSGGLNAMLDRMEALVEAMAQVSSDIAHDLRTPLTRLRNKLEDARMAAPDAAAVAALDEAVADCDGILATFSALLRIAQIEAGGRRAGFGPVDLSELVVRIAAAYEPVAEDGGRRLLARVAPGVGVEGDRELLTQMTVNLVENAIRHTPEGARIYVTLEGGDSPRLTVADDGPGIPPGAREKAFRRFFRLDRSRATPGSGLGLSLVAAVAALHGAAATLSDNAPGLSATVRFPAARR